MLHQLNLQIKQGTLVLLGGKKKHMLQSMYVYLEWKLVQYLIETEKGPSSALTPSQGDG